MKVLSWNCGGLNDPRSPTLPYRVWLTRIKKPNFVFLSETKMSFIDVKTKLAFLNPSSCFGVDSVGSKGGLVVLTWSNAAVSCILKTKNFVFCEIVESNGSLIYILFVYGEPIVEDRGDVWIDLIRIIEQYPNCLIMGDFNQLDNMEDKLGGADVIRGFDQFYDCRLACDLHDVPFSGPRFTWSNKRDGEDLIMERLDRVYATTQWFDSYPNGKFFNQPLICSDHAAILYDSDPEQTRSNRPYQVEGWCLYFPEIKNMIADVWD
ncbi:uncharacterized protein [Spinacia oleracea]|uniref:Endonuclease/exonuclease/phosphatase domain-containing protein n=1 Tax=Spinacia oleracea TaxID=3562 RepID=A0ABM3RSL7_SPIOL|nr:uncharacterized protein LOC130472116 [Spinacia oleracea]